jgi:hypothetical protein
MSKLPSFIHIALLILTAALVAPLLVWGFLGVRHGWAAFALPAIVSTVAVAIGLRGFRIIDERLAAQVLSPHVDEWIVRVNGVSVGTISEQLRASIQREALHDPQLAVAQVANVLMIPVRVLNGALNGLPVAAFWLVLGAYLFYPQELRAFVDRTTELAASGQLLRASSDLLLSIALVLVISIGVAMPFGYRYRLGLRNLYGEFVADTIRRLCDSPAEGDVTLWRRERLEMLRARAQTRANDVAPSSNAG